jgi:mevalonate kinase
VFLRWAAEGSASIEHIDPAKTLYLVVGSLASPRDTLSILNTLQELFYNKEPCSHDPEAVATVHQALTTFGMEAEKGALALKSGDLAALGMAINHCQIVYDRMAARIPSLRAPLLQKAVDGLRKCGALGAKFSGAGGDGSVIALHGDQTSAEYAQAWLSQMTGVSAWIRTIQAPGKAPQMRSAG